MEKFYAIKIENLKKQYRLGQIGGGTLRGDLSSWWAKKRGKEDPNLMIGQERIASGDTFWALNGVNFTIYPGEAVGIIGRNGAGKSTLLKLLSRVTAPTEGKIDVYGRISSMLEVGTGFNGEMTGRENVYMNGAILGMSKSEIDAKIDNIIEFSEVGEFIDTPVKRYSSGMYVKLAFSVAAHLDSEIMIMDEVLAVGDMRFQKKCLDRMKNAANGEGRTVLYVSHNMSTIRKLCERCIVLNEGKVIYDGDVEKAIEIYMGDANNLCAHRKFTMKDYLHSNKNQIQILESLIDHKNCQYEAGESVKIKLICTSTYDVKGVHIYFQFVSNDGVRVGSSYSDCGFDIKAKETKTVYAELPTSELFPSQYLTEIAFYTSDQHTSFNYVNTVKNGFFFEIVPSYNKQNRKIWHPNNGHVHFHDFVLSEDD